MKSTYATYFVNELDNDQLEDVSEGVNLVNTSAEVVQSSILRDIHMGIR